MIKKFSILILSSLFSFLYSCSSNEIEEKKATTFSADFKKNDTLVSFSGSWLSEEYYNSIYEFKSPRKAQDGSEFIVIPEKTLQQTIMVFNFHEGGTFLKVLKHDNKYEIWETYGDSLTQSLYSVEIVSQTKIKLNNKNFVKINSLNIDDEEKILEEILFKGEYTNSNGNSIEFKPNGDLVGLDNYTIYYPIIDYFDAGLDVDQVCLGNSKNDLDWFGFKFKKDTLELYKLNCLSFDSTENRCYEVEYGELIYKLWRK